MKAFIFPGQGSQTIGMGREVFDSFAEAREVFEEVDDALNQSLTKLIFDGSIEELTLTENTQPALMAVSMAVFRVLEKQGGIVLGDIASYVAGHSLGEYTALTAAGSLSISNTAKLLRIRGKAMQNAVPKGEGGMAAVIGVDFEIAEKIASESGSQIANDNSIGQVVVSGTMEAIAAGESIAKEYGAKRYLPLNVSAPFHSKFMKPAASIMQEALDNTDIKTPSVPLIANVTASETDTPEKIREFLVQQVTGMVRWRETIMYMASHGVKTTVEIGAGKVLSGLTKRISKEVGTVSIQTPSDIEKFLEMQLT